MGLMAQKTVPKRILLCDDDQTLVEIVQMLLETEGHTVATALDGNDGLAKYKEFKPDLVILDLDMPHKSGFEVLEAMANGARRPGSHIFVVSIVETPAVVRHIKQLGVDKFLTKPVDPAELVKEVHLTLGTTASGSA